MINQKRSCTRCRRIFPATLVFFNSQRQGKFGLNSRCKQCLKELRQANRAHIKAVHQAYYAQNKKRLRAQHTAYYRTHRKRILAHMHDYYLANRVRKLAYVWEWDLRAYGLTVSQYDAILQAQGGICALCHKPPNGKRLAVEHDHITGKVRGLVHTQCNTVIAWAERNPGALDRLVAYLR